MSYETRKNSQGDLLVIPLEIPMFNGSNEDLGRQAEICLASFLRHIAVCDWILHNLDADGQNAEDYSEEWAQASAQLVGLMMALTGMADNIGIDIMQEIWEMPWEV